MDDFIEIRRLELKCTIGVPDAERSQPQTLWATIRLTPSQSFDGLSDEISRTIDYSEVCDALEMLAGARPRKLIETLALDFADHLLRHYPLKTVRVSIEKRILPNTECVAAHIQRNR